MRSIPSLFGCLAAAAAIALAGCQAASAPSASSQFAPPGADSGSAAGVAPGARPTALPTRAVAASATVAVDGQLELATPLITVSPESSGQVTAVRVLPGQSVKKGDVLAELDSADLETAVQKARETLALKQAQIANSLAPATQAEIDNAQAALSSAYAAYNELKAGASASDVETALRNWNKAKNSLYSSQLSRDETCARQSNTCEQAQLSVKSAELNERAAYQQTLDAQQPAGQDELTKAWSSVMQAKSSLANLQEGASDEQKKVYDLQLRQAEISLARAERDLARASLVSPCDCVVQDVTLAAGASGGSVTLLDTSQVKFYTTNLNERDVVKLQAGQAATIRLKAFTQTFTGTVSAFLPLSSGTLGSVALYTAVIDLDPAGAALLPGMTGQAEITLQ
jgi:multidrug resistance efflux pump